MKTIQKKSACLVSDRAYRTIITNCISVMTEKNVSPDIFMAVIMAVKEYLETGQLAHRPINRVRNIFDLLRADIDRAISRAASARKAAATRRKATCPESELAVPKTSKPKPAPRFYPSSTKGILKPGDTPTPPRPSRGSRCPGIERYQCECSGAI